MLLGTISGQSRDMKAEAGLKPEPSDTEAVPRAASMEHAEGEAGQHEANQGRVSANTHGSVESGVKVRIVGANGGRTTLLDTRKCDDMDLLKRLAELDRDGDGTIDMYDLVAAMSTQQKMREVVATQRVVICGLLAGVLLLSMLTLGSAVLGGYLIKDTFVNDRKLADREGQLLQVDLAEISLGPTGELQARPSGGGFAASRNLDVQTVPRNPNIIGLTLDNRTDSSLRRLFGSPNSLFCNIPLEEVELVMDKYKAGITSFITDVPCLNERVTVAIDRLITMDELNIILQGTAAGSQYVWHAECNAQYAVEQGDEPGCIVAGSIVEASERRMMDQLESRRLQQDSDGPVPFSRRLKKTCVR